MACYNLPFVLYLSVYLIIYLFVLLFIYFVHCLIKKDQL